MTPRFTTLLIVGTVVYVSLSLYHWRQVKNIPAAKRSDAGVSSMLKRSPEEKSWVQVTTAGISPENSIAPAAEHPRIETGQKGEPSAAPGDVEPAEKALHSNGNPTVPSPLQDCQALGEAKMELQKALQHERSINQRQAEKMNSLQETIAALQSELNDTSAHLQKKNIAVEQLKKQVPDLPEKSGIDLPDGSTEKALRHALAAKAEALTRANERIAGLAQLLANSKQTLTRAENASARFQSALSDTENARIQQELEAARLEKELSQAREEKQKYLAETGRLSAELQQAGIRLARLEKERDRARLTSEAMLHYGQEQTELITPFRQKIEVLNARVEDRDEQLSAAEEQMAQLREEEQKLRDKIQALQLEGERNRVLNQELKKTSLALDKAGKHSTELTAQLKALADQLNSRDKTIKELNRQLGQARSAETEAARQNETLRQKAEQQGRDLEEAAKSLARFKKERSAEEARLLAIESKLAEAVAAKEELAGKITEQDKLLAAATTKVEQSAAQLKEKEQQLTQGQEELRNAQARIQELTRSLAETDRREDDAASAEKLQQEIDQLRKSISEITGQKNALDKTVVELKEKNKVLQNQIETAGKNDSRITDLQSALVSKERELAEQKHRLTTLENEGERLRSELKKKETSFFSMQEEFSALQEKFDTLKQERESLLPYTLDTDSDRVSDAKDACPETPQGVVVGPDGCEADTDGDGLVDRLDLCPHSQEPTGTNEFGCAPDVPMILSGLYFSSGNADIVPDSQKYLDKIVAVLQRHQEVSFEVGGHTDNTGEAPRNLTVSKQRAEAVRNYLVVHGIDGGRLVPRGYGSEHPVADNSTLEGMAANRRVELKVITPAASSGLPPAPEAPTASETEDSPAR